MHWVFWDVDIEHLDLDRDKAYILARILEFGRLCDVKWAMKTYGPDQIHDFFKNTGHPETSDRTLAFWRAFFKTPGEEWQTSAPFRKHSSAPWIS